MAFGVYVHIPYCLQRCVYCDFATYEMSQILPPREYINRVKKEIEVKGQAVLPRPLDTLYFGGGTPSLLDPPLLSEVIEALENAGFPLKKESEVTLEINPATLTERKLELLIESGFNRFSVGAQSFDDLLLKRAHRKHSPQDTHDTLSLLKKYGLNFSIDILFALPTQKLAGLLQDIHEALEYDPPHVSPYCLTVPESNPMALGRPTEEHQVEMFNLIQKHLEEAGLVRYEISNFAKPGFESRHNSLYWNDDPYWGIGLSSHSYLHEGPWGTRFWNPRSIANYVNQIDGLDSWSLEALDDSSCERLEEHQALTDFFHVMLRTKNGFDAGRFERKFKKSLDSVVGNSLEKLIGLGWVDKNDTVYTLTPSGLLVSNRVFEELTFLKDRNDHQH